MSLPAIEVSGLSKRYVIEHESRHDNLRDTLHHAARKLWRRARWGTQFEREEFWALRDVSFSIQPGEVVGVIGRNGAGKSTLLKILSRITEPSSGKISIRGRVASLLEVGTGFHPDLTGRENIFLNGAILGMSRVEIRKKFDEIVAFAEIERFLDTPVKRYSSGMYVRLAFAVAAHLEPEILIVDEVLAVGDAQFQKKCLGKMQDVARNQGRTVLFVSHNISAINQLCSRAILLNAGRVECDGPASATLARYQPTLPLNNEYVRPADAADENRAAVVTRATLSEPEPASSGSGAGRSLRLGIEILVRNKTIPNVQVAVRVSAADGTALLTTTDCDAARQLQALAPGRHHYELDLPQILVPGRYSVLVAVCQPRQHAFDIVEGKLQFEISPQHSIGHFLNDDRSGLIELPVAWRHRHQA